MRKRGRKRILAWLAVLTILLENLQGVMAADLSAEPQNAASVEITEEDLSANEYETYYYMPDCAYTYQGNAVNFISETQMQAGSETYELRNKAVNVSIQQAEGGNITITLDGIQTPVGSVSGKWNSSFAGVVQAVYQTDIPGAAEVRSAESEQLQNTITLSNVPEGTWTLSGGTIYERTNEWSPGIDFGDGNGVVTEGYFGVLPDITFSVEGTVPEPEPNPEPNPNPEPEPNPNPEPDPGPTPEPQPENRVGRLKDLQITGGVLSPEFSSGTIYYTLKVQEETTTVSVNPTAETEDTIVLIRDGNGDIYSPGSQIPVAVGDKLRISAALDIATSYFITVKTEEKEPEPEYGFEFSANGTVFPLVSDGVHEDGTPILKIAIPKGTKTLHMERFVQTMVKEQGEDGKILIMNGVGGAVLPTESYLGKEHYFIVETEKQQYYVYLEEVKSEIDETLPRMEITEEDLSANKYETYYYSDQINYYYKDAYVVFTDSEHFMAGTETYPLKNQKTDIVTAMNEDGKMTIRLTDLAVPVRSIAGAWNSDFGGKVQIVYETDIPGMPEIRSEDLENPIVLEKIADGIYHLTKGTIYEKANPYSPGYDFGDGKGTVTEGCFGTLPDILLKVENPIETPEEYVGDATKAEVYEDFENDLWLQYQQKEMKVGETVDLYPWRVPQIVSDSINNDVKRPVFHFELIQGDSVSLNTESSTQKAIVKAEKAGTSIVKVTYDGVNYQKQHWGANSPVNTAYAVFTVGEEGKAVIRTNSELQNWRHYDTIYYHEGDTVPYTFTVDTEHAKAVKVTVNGIEIEGNGNQYTANLENRSNIIGIVATDEDGNTTSMYRVVDARYIEIHVKNKTNAGKELKAGEKANISFRGITMPVYKLATMYNPQFGKGVTRVLYENEKLGSLEGKCSQWDLAVNNDFDVTFPEEGVYNFTSPQGIYSAWWGEKLGADMVKQGQGDPNLSAVSRKDSFSILPSFSVTVAESEITPEPEPNPNPGVTETDRKLAAEVIQKIDNLGEITLLKEPMVMQARKAYDALTDVQKGLVTNLDVLKNAEAKIQKLKAEAEEHQQKPSVLKPGGGSSGSGNRIPVKTTVQKKKDGGESSSNVIRLEVKNHKVPKEEIEKIQGQDKNLILTDQLADGTKYTMTIYGKDVKKAMDFNTEIKKTSKYEKEIQMLAPEPDIFAFEQKGEYPGEILVQIETQKEDGTYLLFRYDAKIQKAVYVQKVTVKDGKAKFVVSQGGDYFIDEKAKTKSIAELKELENAAEMAEEVTAVDVSEKAEKGVDGKSLLVGILIGAGVVALIGGGCLLIRRKQKRG